MKLEEQLHDADGMAGVSDMQGRLGETRNAEHSGWVNLREHINRRTSKLVGG